MATVTLYLVHLLMGCTPAMHGLSTMTSRPSSFLIGGEGNSPNTYGSIMVEYFTGTGAIKRQPKVQRSNPEA